MTATQLLTLGDRLKWALNKSGASQKQLADFLGVTTAAVSQWVTGGNKPTRPDKIEEFFETLDIDFRVTPWWLFNGGELPKRRGQDDVFDQNKYVVVPSIDIKACCGNGYAIEFESVSGGFAFRKEWVTRMGLDGHNLEVIRASGKSMEPTIFDGNILLVDRSDTILSRTKAKIYVVGYDGDVMIKRVKLEEDAIILSADNENKKEFHNIIIKLNSESQLTETFHVLGRVVWQGGIL